MRPRSDATRELRRGRRVRLPGRRDTCRGIELEFNAQYTPPFVPSVPHRTLQERPPMRQPPDLSRIRASIPLLAAVPLALAGCAEYERIERGPDWPTGALAGNLDAPLGSAGGGADRVGSTSSDGGTSTEGPTLGEIAALARRWCRLRHECATATSEYYDDPYIYFEYHGGFYGCRGSPGWHPSCFQEVEEWLECELEVFLCRGEDGTYRNPGTLASCTDAFLAQNDCNNSYPSVLYDYDY